MSSRTAQRKTPKVPPKKDVASIEKKYEVVLKNLALSGAPIIPISVVSESSRFQASNYFAQVAKKKSAKAAQQQQNLQRQRQQRLAKKATERTKQAMVYKLVPQSNEKPEILRFEEGETFSADARNPASVMYGKTPSKSRQLQEKIDKVIAEAKSHHAVYHSETVETVLCEDDEEEGDSSEDELANRTMDPINSPVPDCLNLTYSQSPPPKSSSHPRPSFSFPSDLPKTLTPFIEAPSSSSLCTLSYSQHFEESPGHFVLSSLLGSDGSEPSPLPKNTRKRKRETAEERQHNLNTDLLQSKLNASKGSNKKKASSSPSKRRIRDNQELSHQSLRLENAIYHHEKQHCLSLCEHSFPLWLTSLILGRNLLLYGFGSKKLLIEQFLNDGITQNFPCLVVNGYHKAFSLKALLDSITADLLGYFGVTFSTPLVQCEFVAEYFDACYPTKTSSPSYQQLSAHLKPEERTKIRAPEHVFIAIHNIERVGPHATHNILSLLASVPQIHVIASVDHIFTPLEWDDGVRVRFNWICENTATYQPYYYETRDDYFFEQTSSNKEECIRNVLNTLGSYGWRCFCVLAEASIARKKVTGLHFGDWFSRCCDAGIFNNEEAMRKTVKEFEDHKFLKMSNKDGQPYHRIIASYEAIESLLKEGEREGGKFRR